MSFNAREILYKTLGDQVSSAAEAALRFARDRDFTGTDPYDGLLSPAAPLLKGRLPRQAWVQAHKRLGDSLRSVTRVPKVTMTKAMALFAMAERCEGNPERANELITRILCTRGAGPWGYEFDVQTRWAHYLANSPNVVATVFALRAFAATDRLGRSPRGPLLGSKAWPTRTASSATRRPPIVWCTTGRCWPRNPGHPGRGPESDSEGRHPHRGRAGR